jgi:hypothetical protein
MRCSRTRPFPFCLTGFLYLLIKQNVSGLGAVFLRIPVVTSGILSLVFSLDRPALLLLHALQLHLPSTQVRHKSIVEPEPALLVLSQNITGVVTSLSRRTVVVDNSTEPVLVRSGTFGCMAQSLLRDLKLKRIGDSLRNLLGTKGRVVLEPLQMKDQDRGKSLDQELLSPVSIGIIDGDFLNGAKVLDRVNNALDVRRLDVELERGEGFLGDRARASRGVDHTSENTTKDLADGRFRGLGGPCDRSLVLGADLQPLSVGLVGTVGLGLSRELLQGLDSLLVKGVKPQPKELFGILLLAALDGH